MNPKDVPISHPDKMLFPEAGIRKRDLATYYGRIAPYLLPHIQGRALTLKQFPHGIAAEGFFHKHAPGYFPDFIQRLTVPLRSQPGKTIPMVAADAAADLVYLAGQSTIELHMSLSRIGALDQPDQIIFDLDPTDEDFAKVRQTAFALKALLDEREVPSVVKTTGSRGLHIHVPLRVDKPFKEVKRIVRQLAETLHRQIPDLTTLEHRKDHRGQKVYIDYLRNDYGMTAIVPYSLRALPGAPVATPIDWEELSNTALTPQSYHLGNIFRRLGQKEDPWAGFAEAGVAVERLAV